MEELTWNSKHIPKRDVVALCQEKVSFVQHVNDDVNCANFKDVVADYGKRNADAWVSLILPLILDRDDDAGEIEKE